MGYMNYTPTPDDLNCLVVSAVGEFIKLTYVIAFPIFCSITDANVINMFAGYVIGYPVIYMILNYIISMLPIFSTVEGRNKCVMMLQTYFSSYAIIAICYIGLFMLTYKVAGKIFSNRVLIFVYMVSVIYATNLLVVIRAILGK